jgi:excisionase family DNA binding protein
MGRTNPSQETKDESFLSVDDVARRMKVLNAWIYRKARCGLIPHFRLGGVIRFVPKDVEDWLNSHKVKGVVGPWHSRR